MIEVPTFFVGVAMGVAIAAPVGPVAVLCGLRTLSRGRLHGFASALGAGLADGVYGALATLGVGALASAVTRHEFAVRMFGAVVLFAMAAQAWVQPPKALDDASSLRVQGVLRDLTTALLLTLSSPLTVLTFAVILANVGTLHGPRWLVIPGVVTGSFGWYASLCVVAHWLLPRVRHRMHLVGRFSAAFLLACALLSFGAGLLARWPGRNVMQ